MAPGDETRPSTPRRNLPPWRATLRRGREDGRTRRSASLHKPRGRDEARTCTPQVPARGAGFCTRRHEPPARRKSETLRRLPNSEKSATPAPGRRNRPRMPLGRFGRTPVRPRGRSRLRRPFPVRRRREHGTRNPEHGTGNRGAGERPTTTTRTRTSGRGNGRSRSRVRSRSRAGTGNREQGTGNREPGTRSPVRSLAVSGLPVSGLRHPVFRLAGAICRRAGRDPRAWRPS